MTIDNIYILNHIVQRKNQKRGKVYALFVDLKAAFDRIDREKLWRIMEEKGINNKMIGRVKKMYENTEVMVRINEGIQGFRTRKSVRQGYVMSPFLLNIYMADLDRSFEKRSVGEIKIGDSRV